MRRVWVPLGGIAVAGALIASSSAQAQVRTPPAPVSAAAIDPASVTMPNLAFTPDAEAERNYFKYFFFHRADTDFASAYADLQECDGYARGLAYRAGYTHAYTGMGLLPSAIGGAIGSAMADAIFGSAERRMQRRAVMRTCMGFKGYTAFGLAKNVWEAFNFDEGNSSLPEERRQELLRMQARAATGPRPTIGEMVQ
jgi:hypothetical protein